MRCLSCDTALNAFEATRKSEKTGEYLDLCNRCLSTTDIDTPDERYDLEGVDERFRDGLPEDPDTDIDGS